MFHVLALCRDLRRPGSSPVKTESEQPSGVHGSLKTCVVVKLEKTQGGPEQRSTADKPTLLSKPVAELHHQPVNYKEV